MIALQDILTSFGGQVVSDQGGAVWGAREACASPASPSSTKGKHLRRSQYTFQMEVESFIKRHGLERVLVCCITVDDNAAAFSVPEIRRRWHNFRKDLSLHFAEWVAVVEKSASGRNHIHFICVADGDVRTGFPWHFHDAKKRGRYPGVSPVWRSAKTWIGARARAHGFGRIFSVLPVRKTGEAAAVYLSKYLSKPGYLYKGARRISYSASWQRCSCQRFTWCSRTRCVVSSLLSDFVARLRSVGLDEGYIQSRVCKIRRQAAVAFTRNPDVSYVDWVARVVGWDGHELPPGYVFGRLPMAGDVGVEYGGMSVTASRSGGWWEFASFHDADYPVGSPPPWAFQKPLRRTVCMVKQKGVPCEDTSNCV